MASQAYKRRDVWGNVTYAGKSTRADTGAEPWEARDREHRQRSQMRRDRVRSYDAVVETYADDAGARRREKEWIDRFKPPGNISGNPNHANIKEKYDRAIEDGTPHLIDVTHADDYAERMPPDCLDRMTVVLRHPPGRTRR
jgi:hypothetical protein